MQFLLITGLLALFVATYANKNKGELKIDVQYKPDDCWEQATIGDEVHVHYTGTLENGQLFDTSRQEGREPLPFVLGARKVIPGWEQGIEGMCVGEKRKLRIPPHLGYGSTGAPPVIPPDATLIFETELMAIKRTPAEQNFFKLAQFLAIPALVIYVLWSLYKKYNSEQETQKESKQEKKGKGSKKRR